MAQSQLRAHRTAGGDWSAAGNRLRAGHLMSSLRAQLGGPEGAEAVRKLQAVFLFRIGDVEGGSGAAWVLDLKKGEVREVSAAQVGALTPKPDATFVLSDDNFVALASGKLNPQVAFLAGKLKLQGNLAKAMQFNTQVFQQEAIKKKINEALKQLPSKL